MAISTPSQTSPPAEPLTPLQQAANIDLLKRNLAIGLLVTCPILIALPPRKLDVYTFCLAGTTFISLNHLQKHTTGRSFLNRIGINSEAPTLAGENVDAPGAYGAGLPTDKARRYQQLLREKKDAEARGVKWTPPRDIDAVEVRRDEKKPTGVLEGLWLGNEDKETWKEKRDRKEREALERGDGVGTLIQEYFAEAMGFKEDDEVEDKDADEKKK